MVIEHLNRHRLIVVFVMNLVFVFIGLWYWIQQKGAKQPVRIETMTNHVNKSGTPTMGGLFLWLILPISWLLQRGPHEQLFWPLWAWWTVLGLLGGWDDWQKIQRQHHRGLAGKYKLLISTGMAVGLSWYWLSNYPHITWQMGWHMLPLSHVMFLCLTTFSLVGSSQAINLTDGLDGLAANCLLLIFLWLAVVSVIEMQPDRALEWGLMYEPHAGSWLLIITGVVAGLMSFLYFNQYPAQVFMGDIGALTMGGLMAAAAIGLHVIFWLICVALIPVLETLSVMIQVAWFKKTGRRVFKMAPLHHHFELSGWLETSIVARAQWLTLGLVFFCLFCWLC